MKEQVSVDDIEYIKLGCLPWAKDKLERLLEEYERLKQREEENEKLLNVLREIKINAENNVYAINELKRLKRLDDNVKNLIAHKKSLYKSVRTCQSDNLSHKVDLFLQIEELGKLLK